MSCTTGTNSRPSSRLSRSLYLPEIFQFTPGQELEEAYDILRLKACQSSNTCDPLEILRQQLLATELNDVSGFGLVDDPALQDVLIAWGEAVWVENQEGEPGVATLGAGHGDDQVEVTPLVNRFLAGGHRDLRPDQHRRRRRGGREALVAGLTRGS